jgi:thiamine biosynthesis lipoprotein
MTTLRRAQPWLGTLVEIGVPLGALNPEWANQAVADAFAVVAQVHRVMSRFDPDSDVSRFHRAEVGQAVRINRHTREVLDLALQLHQQTGGLFDVALGSGRWDLNANGHWLKLDAQAQVDLGGIAKGYAVDAAMGVLVSRELTAAWVNAGGDVRVMGTRVPVDLRDESQGGVRRWAEIEDGAVATSYFGPDARSVLHGAIHARHVTVAAPQCAVADALTKVVARVGLEAAAPWLQFFEAQAWIHA